MSSSSDFIIEDGVLKKYSGSGRKVRIPEGVCRVESLAFYEQRTIQTVTFSEGVQSIGYRAFSDCPALRSVTIPGTVMLIEDNAFSYCEALQTVELAEGVTTIGDNVFRGCKKLLQIDIPKSVTSIGHAVFYGCTHLKQVTLPEKMPFIGHEMFRDCSNLRGITIPESVKSIYGYAFTWCEKMETVCVPDGVMYIGEEVFCGCEKLRSLTIINAPYADFRGCKALEILCTPQIPLSVLKKDNLQLPGALGFTMRPSAYTETEIVSAYEKYLVSQRKRVLQMAFKYDLVETVIYYHSIGKITPKNYMEEYLKPAQIARATRCVAWLMDWLDEDHPVQ